MTLDLDEALSGFLVTSLGGRNAVSTSWWLSNHKGTYEMAFDTLDELVTYFQAQPKLRQKKGIIIWGSLTHLEDPEASKPDMTAHRRKLYKNSGWLKKEREFVAALAKACRALEIDVWVNTNLGVKAVKFINLRYEE